MPRALLFCLIAVALAACPTTYDVARDDDDATSSGGVALSTTSPAPDQEHFFRANLEVVFTGAPEEATLELVDATGAVLAGATTWGAEGTRLTFDPAQDLEPVSDYAATVTWTPTDFDPVVIPFSTDRYGLPLDDPGTLVGAIYNLDLPGATYVEPVGLGPLLVGLMEDLGILLTVTADSDLDPAAQPGLYMLGGLGNVQGEDVGQDPCTETLDWTAGPDEIVGDEGDTPATFDDPFLRFGPTNLDLSIAGRSARLSDATLFGVWHPDGRDLRGGEFEALIDTRGFDGLFGDGAKVGALCDMVNDNLAANCTECGGPVPGEYCLYAKAVDVTALRRDDVGLEPLGCAEVLANFEAGLCALEDVLDLDPDGDGVPTCP